MMNQKSFVFLGLVLLLIIQHSIAEEEHDEEIEEIEEHYAILFPWFVELLGVLVFYISTRYFKIFPYTAIMFMLGTFMGIGVNRLNNTDQLSESIRIWEGINSEVLLLVFLPGLIFHDAYSLNVHLFQVSFGQCLLLAFPMVLAGTTLVACVAFYIFPYNWSFNLAMTFGSILAATDPVAVSALLNEVGAPPRLKMHISGESLLNDGSAIVFFTIFSGLFLTELNAGVGEDVNFAEGLVLFLRMSLGGACIGIAFGVGLVLVLYCLNRRLAAEENVLQVASTITCAYMCYYVADAVAGTSGVIAVVFCGVFTRAFGSSMINDEELMDSFWVLVEHLLNTLLFALGGAVWGQIISNVDPREFGIQDWGYLILLYVLMTVIRAFLIAVFYPVFSSIGLKSSWQEAVFMSYGGLRGAVGISLAIALDDEVFRNTKDEEFRDNSTKLFGMVGGIAFLTLFINGSTAGMFLKKLGLTRASEVREKMVTSYYRKLDEKLLDAFVHLLANPLFANADFSIVKHHVPFLEDLTADKLKEAVLKNKSNVPAKIYHKPKLHGILPYLVRSEGEQTEYDSSWVTELEEYEMNVCLGLRQSFRIHQVVEEADLATLETEHSDNPVTKELRLIFLEVLRASYAKMIHKGILDVRAGSPGFVAFALDQSIEFAIDAVNNGKPLMDWDFAFIIQQPLEDGGFRAVGHLTRPLRKFLGKNVLPSPEKSNQQLQLDVHRGIAFLEGHELARRLFEQEFCGGEVTGCQKLILRESLIESERARKMLSQLNDGDVQHVLSHALSLIMLNKASRFVEGILVRGLLHETEATEKIEEIEGHIEALRVCAETHHPGELSESEKNEVMEKDKEDELFSKPNTSTLHIGESFS